MCVCVCVCGCGWVCVCVWGGGRSVNETRLPLALALWPQSMYSRTANATASKFLAVQSPTLETKTADAISHFEIQNKGYCTFIIDRCTKCLTPSLPRPANSIFFRSYKHLLSMLCVWMNILSHASAKKKKKKGFRFRTFTGCF